MTTATEQNILKGCGKSDSVEYEEDYTFCGDEDNERRLCPFCTGKLEGYQLAQKENQEQIKDEALKTTYPLALKRGMEIVRKETAEKVEKFIDYCIHYSQFNSVGKMVPMIDVAEFKKELKDKVFKDNTTKEAEEK